MRAQAMEREAGDPPPGAAGVDPEEFRRRMRRLASGVTIITTAHEQRRRGLTATGLCSLSIRLPSLVVCVNRAAEAHDMIIAARRLCVNVLDGHHRFLAESFAGRDGSKGESRFLRGEWITLATGAPCFKDSVAAFDCTLFDFYSIATHSIMVCHVVATHGTSGDDPLLYFDGGFAAVGPHVIDRAAHEVGEWL